MGPWPRFQYTRYINPLSMCVPSFNFVNLTVLEKKETKIYLITGWTEGKEEMMDERNDGRNNRRIGQIKFSPTFFKAGL